MKRSMCIDVRRHRLCAKNTNMSRRKANTNTIRQYTICNTHFSSTIYFIGGFAHRLLCFFMFYFIIIIISAIKPNKPCKHNMRAPFYTRPIRSKWMRAAASAMKRGNIKTRYIEINFISNLTRNLLIWTYFQFLIHWCSLKETELTTTLKINGLSSNIEFSKFQSSNIESNIRPSYNENMFVSMEWTGLDWSLMLLLCFMTSTIDTHFA